MRDVDIDTSPTGILPFVREFLALYQTRPIVDNSGGMKAPQCFWTWYFLKKVDPLVVIESGVWYGLSTWLIEKACPTARIVSIDPNLHYRKYRSDRAEYTTLDFNCHDWTLELGGRDVCRATLAFIDDHQDNFERLKHAHAHSIGHMLLEDNYPTSHGDVLSLKKILSDTYHIVEANRTRVRREIPPHYRASVMEMCRYFECPIPYLDTPVTRWGDTFQEHSAKPPIFRTLRDDIDLSQLKEDQLNYTFIAYVQVRPRAVLGGVGPAI
jgi:hypothetical protein